MSAGGPFSERILVLTPTGRDGEIGSKLLREASFAAQVQPDIPSLAEAMSRGAAMAIVAEEALRTSDLRPLTNFLALQEPWSDLPILVLTRAGGGPERNPALRRLAELLGNITFLERPFHPATLVSIATAALRGRKRQYQARATLEELRQAAQHQRWLIDLDDKLRDLSNPADVSFAAAEFLARVLNVVRAGYGTINKRVETITIERDWNVPGVESLAGVLRFRDYGSYIDELKRGETVVIADARLDPRTADTAKALENIQARAFVNMPVTEDGETVALLYLTHDVARAWTEEELAFIREVAHRTRLATARRQAEHDLRVLATSLEQQVEERTADLDRVWRNSNDLQVVGAVDGLLRAISPASINILGYAPAEMIGHNLLNFIWAEDAKATREALSEAAVTGNLSNFENRFRHKDGSVRWLSWNMTSEVDRIYAYGRDITHSKEQQLALASAEEQLRQSQKMEAVGQLTGGLAHDFNNLLAAISGSLEMLEARLSQGRTGEYERYLSAAKSSAKRAAALTHRLLAFSRRQTLDPKPTNVNRLVNGLEELIRRTVGPEITVEVVGAAGLWPTFVDAGQLENSLLNLCINARDAMPDGGRLTIETGNRWIDTRSGREHDLVPGQYISLCVSDTGTGMSPETIAHAFDPFYTTKPLGQGTGLGLSMVYGFAKQSGGQARIYSEIGRGTMVCIYLPRYLSEGEVADEIEISSPRATHDSIGKTVLVVDDEVIIRMLIVDVLTDLGYQAIEASDGRSALALLEDGAKIDLMITDVGLPNGMNGRQVADAARARQPGLKIMFITGYAENAVIGNGHLEPGMQVLTKPFQVNELSRRISEILAPGGAL